MSVGGNIKHVDMADMDRVTATNPPSGQPEFTRYLNVENAKYLAFLMVIGFVMYHGVIHLKYGKCI